MNIEVITHCFGKGYAAMLQYHLSSFVLHPPSQPNTVKVTVWHSNDDAATAAVVQWFAWQRHLTPPGLTITYCQASSAEVCSRAIGRCKSALETKAHWVWFCDCDYVVGPGWIDRMADVLAKSPYSLVYPRIVGALPYDVGPKLVEQTVTGVCLRDIPRDIAKPQRFRKAIGGVQFVPGFVCRRLGYCCGDRREQRPSLGGWKRESSDVRFRKILGTNGNAVECPGLYRIRHEGRL